MIRKKVYDYLHTYYFRYYFGKQRIIYQFVCYRYTNWRFNDFIRLFDQYIIACEIFHLYLEKKFGIGKKVRYITESCECQSIYSFVYYNGGGTLIMTRVIYTQTISAWHGSIIPRPADEILIPMLEFKLFTARDMLDFFLVLKLFFVYT